MPPKKWTVGQNAAGEGIELLQACSEYLSNTIASTILYQHAQGMPP